MQDQVWSYIKRRRNEMGICETSMEGVLYKRPTSLGSLDIQGRPPFSFVLRRRRRRLSFLSLFSALHYPFYFSFLCFQRRKGKPEMVIVDLRVASYFIYFSTLLNKEEESEKERQKQVLWSTKKKAVE